MEHLPDAGMDHFPALRYQGFADNLVLAVEMELAILHEIFEEGGDVLRVHLAGVVRDGRGQVERAVDADTTLVDDFAGTGEFAISPTLRRDIDNHGARLHAGYHFARDQHRGLAAGDGGGGDHDIVFGQHRGHRCALTAVEI